MKKLLVVLLAAAMCLSMLAGCSGKSDTSSSTTTESSAAEESSKAESSAAESSTAAESSATEESSEPESNAELRDFTFVGDNAFVTYYDMDDSLEEFTAWKAFREMMEKAGINLKGEYIQHDQYTTTLQTRFAALNQIPMFCYDTMQQSEILSLADQGVILDINPMLDAGNGTAKKFFTENDFGTQAYRKVCTPEGQMYWLPNMYITNFNGTYGVGTNITVTIRGDWLDKVGLDIPTTTDEFTAALKAFNEQDPSGSGANVAGMNVYSYNPCDWNDAIAQWYGLVRGPIVNVNWDEEKAMSPWQQDTVKDYFAYVSDLYNQGLYDQEMIGSNDTLSSKESNNQVGATTTYATETGIEPTIESAFKADGGGAVYYDIYPITAVEGVTPLLALEDPVYIWSQFVFTNQLTDTQLGADFLDTYYSDESIDLINYGVEGVNYNIVNGEKQWIQYDATVEGAGVKYDADQQNKYQQEKADARLSFGKLLYSRTLFPDMTYYMLGKDVKQLGEQIWPAQKEDYSNQTIDYGHWTSIDVNGTLATPSAEETETTNNIYNDLLSASEQDVSAIILGQSSIDDIDTMVAQLNDLGLQDLVAVYQARYNRFKGID